MSFVSTYIHSIDSKKRVFVPSKFREELGEEFYITRKFDRYLSVYTAEDWEAYVEKLERLPESEAVDIQNFILGAAQKCVPDASGRIILDERLIEYAGITKDIAFVGVGRQIRLFAKEVWEKSERDRLDNLDLIREKMAKFGL